MIVLREILLPRSGPISTIAGIPSHTKARTLIEPLGDNNSLGDNNRALPALVQDEPFELFVQSVTSTGTGLPVSIMDVGLRLHPMCRLLPANGTLPGVPLTPIDTHASVTLVPDGPLTIMLVDPAPPGGTATAVGCDSGSASIAVYPTLSVA